jgi:hypothetical protein
MKVKEAIFSSPAFIFLVVPGLLLYVVGTILFGVAIWRSGTLPKWAGVLYAPTGLLIEAGALTSAWLAYFREPDKAEVRRTP